MECQGKAPITNKFHHQIIQCRRDPENRPSREHRRVRLTAQPGPSHMQARKKGILTPETAHTAQQCLDHPNPEPDSHLPAAATGPHPLEAMSFPVEARNGRVKNEDDENFAGLRGSVSAEEEAHKLSNKEDWRDSDVR